MNARNYVVLSAVIFALVAVVHLLRVVLQWDVVVGGHTVPMWASFLCILFAAGLSAAGFWVVHQIHKYLT